MRRLFLAPVLSIALVVGLLAHLPQTKAETDGTGVVNSFLPRPSLHLSQNTSAPLANYANCRFGVSGHAVSDYDVAALNIGWYVNWGAQVSPPTPGGMEFVQMVRLRQVGATDWDFANGQTLTSTLNAIDANPGAVWLVGNEPDSPAQDEMLPKAYANAYHDVYAIIKERDPTARVGIGGIVQPTSLRLVYLDTVWDAYLQTFGERMPVDIWNIHSFILRETIAVPDPEPCGPDTVAVWGAFIPSGSMAQSGELYCIRDQDNLEIFGQRIRDFRQWMAEKGERNKPLIITEFGVLFYEDFHDEDNNTFNQERVGTFMTGTFDLMLNQTDPLIGYPYDDNRLVQRWTWFSLHEDPHDWGGTLFDPDTHEMRLLGQIFRDYTALISPTVDLLAVQAYAADVYWHEDAPVTATIKVVVSNVGNISTTLPVTVDFFDGPPGEAGTLPIGSAQTIDTGLQGCADYAVISTTWPGLGTGAHIFYAQVDGAGLIDEADETNNVTSGVVLVATERAYLPLMNKGAD